MAEYIVGDGCRPGHWRVVKDEKGNIQGTVLIPPGETVTMPDDEVPSINFIPVDEPAKLAHAKRVAEVEARKAFNKSQDEIRRGGLTGETAAKLEALRLENENVRMQLELERLKNGTAAVQSQPAAKEPPPDTNAGIQAQQFKGQRRA